METVVLDDAEAVAAHAARVVAGILRQAVADRGFASVALSGGRTPGRMFDLLSGEAVPWPEVHVFQTDERLVAREHPASNGLAIRRRLVERVPLPPGRAHWMPVEAEDPERGARRYAEALHAVAGLPPRLDVVHLGLGEDGHTASLFPGDPAALDRTRDVAITAEHGGWRRMTLTAPVLEAARHLVWVVCGEAKRAALGALLRADPTTPAGRLPPSRALLVADRQAAAGQEPDRGPGPA